MLRFAKLAGVGFALLLGLLYAGDWAVWRLREGRGTALGTVEVSQVSVASLKGNKEEYYPDSTTAVACSRSIFPIAAGDGWLTPCWWLRGHAQVVVRY